MINHIATVDEINDMLSEIAEKEKFLHLFVFYKLRKLYILFSSNKLL